MYGTAKSILVAILGSFWFVPGLLGIVALALAAMLLQIDSTNWASALYQHPFVPRFGPDGARALLTTIAGGMMTMASLVFSLTFVGLTLVSGQLGPRIITLFMHDHATQVMLGAFVGIFLFALVVLSTVSEIEAGFVPHLSVMVAMILATFAFALVIYFIHHLAQSIQADNLVATLGKRFVRAIGRITETSQAYDSATANSALRHVEPFNGETVPAPKSGYIGHFDYDGLLTTAKNHDLFIKLLARPDDHIIKGFPLLEIQGNFEPELNLAQYVTIGARRDMLQEATYEARALVEIALRALSPGINDPNTAVAAIDKLAVGLTHFVRGNPPPRVLFDDTGTARVVRPDLGLAHYLNLIVPALLPALRSDTLATERLIVLLVKLDTVAKTPPEKEAIAHWLGVTRSDIADHALPQALRDWLTQSCQAQDPSATQGEN